MEIPVAGMSPTPSGDGAPQQNEGAVAPKGAEGQVKPGTNLDAKAAEQEKAAEAAKPSAKKYKFQVDGREIEEELTEEDLVKRAQKAYGADKRFQEANEAKQKIGRMLEMMKTPEGLQKLLEHPNLYGPKARQVMEELLWKQIQREQMDPKERENLELREQLRQREEQDKATAEQQRREQFEKTKSDYAQQIDKEIVDAIKSAGQQVTPYFFKRVAHYMLSAIQQGKQVSPKDVVPLVQEDLQNDLRAMFETTTEDQLLGLLKSDKAWENIRKADLKRVRTPAPVQNAQSQTPRQDSKKTASDPNELTKRTSIFDW